MGWIPELILSSDATRTKETLHLMREHAACFLEAKVRYVPSFYSVAAMDGQTAEHLQKAVCEYSEDEILTVMCMGHNKGWEEAASMLAGASIELKTCNAALLEASGQSWNELYYSLESFVTLVIYELEGTILYKEKIRQLLEPFVISTSCALFISCHLQAFASAGLGGWKLHGIVKPESV
ncbi:unnamed protein product [Spirodela intermedia]|uniref:Uncharacterized protein n=1 Tax=Spirodela intermedia TaxID=51605 RepID=A0A7I8JJ00_SPIIN|nr:unnamed protein product [Spirodela intermedia]CAA6670137.1 unnamed protein product [Spirodela intermedia]